MRFEGLKYMSLTNILCLFYRTGWRNLLNCSEVFGITGLYGSAFPFSVAYKWEVNCYILFQWNLDITNPKEVLGVMGDIFCPSNSNKTLSWFTDFDSLLALHYILYIFSPGNKGHLATQKNNYENFCLFWLALTLLTRLWKFKFSFVVPLCFQYN